MSARPVNDAESVQRSVAILRELNLYPLWQLRTTPAQKPAVAEVVAATPPSAAHPISASLPATALADIPPVSELSWATLKKRVKNCSACELRAGCTQTVFGSGDENADWLLVGSWPTEDDDLQGDPFAGQAGQLLDNMLAALKLSRSQNVYLANIVKCSGSITRGPQAQQIAQCAPYLTRQIQLLQPKIIIALGHAAATALLGADLEWSALINKIHSYQVVEKNNSIKSIPLIITHHPAALLLTPLNKSQTWRDLCLARETILGMQQG
jgi:uracil-DNA glycosylase